MTFFYDRFLRCGKYFAVAGCLVVLSVQPLWGGTSPEAAAEAATKAETQAGEEAEVRSGDLLIPGAADEGKKCVRICETWGRDCDVNSRTGARKCRRVCRSYTRECF